MSLVKQLRANNKKIYPVTTTDAVLFGGAVPITDAMRELMLPKMYYGARFTSFNVSGSGRFDDEDILGTKSILSKIVDNFKPCVAKGNKIQYYLDVYNMDYKENGEPAILDGTDGTVRIHTPKFYGFLGLRDGYYELLVSDTNLGEGWIEIPEMLIDAYVCTKTTRGWESIVNLTGDNAIAEDPIAELLNVPEGSKQVDYFVWKWIFVFLRILDEECINPCTDPMAPWPWTRGSSGEFSGTKKGTAGFWNESAGISDNWSNSPNQSLYVSESYTHPSMVENINVPANDEIFYTNGSTTTPITLESSNFDATIVSNTYDEDKALWIVKFNNEITSIGDYTFDNTSVRDVYIPRSVTQLGSNAFGFCYRIKNVYFFSETPPNLAEDSFYNVFDSEYPPTIVVIGNDRTVTAYDNAGYRRVSQSDGTIPGSMWSKVYPSYRINRWRYFENPDGFGTKLFPDLRFVQSSRYEYLLKCNEEVLWTGYTDAEESLTKFSEFWVDEEFDIKTGYPYSYFKSNFVAYNNWEPGEYYISYNAAIIPPDGSVHYLGHTTSYVGTCSVTNLYIGNPQYAIENLQNRYSVRTYSLV